MDSSASSTRKHDVNREKYLLKVISPAIKGKTCPICLKELNDHRKIAVVSVCLHAYCLGCIRRWSDFKRKCPLCNATYNSLFYKISFSSRNFLTETLPELERNVKNHRTEGQFSSRRVPEQRSMMTLTRRSRALPWRRTFGRPGSVPCSIVAERKLQWRSSIYKRSLKAVPLSPLNCLQQNVLKDGYTKEKVLQRIEPWIRRELQAILEDPDPSVIVHVASSLFISRLEGKSDVRAGQYGDEDSFIVPLRPFLQNWTNVFWHELRCFAATSLTMETYDAVVTYVPAD
ncbi:uncharacterized protein LOC126670623 [Mercurialis annua]|uniref:uncharacterized protein LOC126670623 n=1 Tax=Mercurialis annua TaxID=3986 RepID=UPI00215E6D7A|nr:uncharacterized protein LOC126670623 [Mercurialis annua]